MKILYQDLLKFFKESPTKEEVSTKLFKIGHEHELKDETFDMELTPNRGDCLSVHGLARDLNIFFGKNRSLNLYDKEIEDLEFDFVNLSPNDCPKISFLEVEIDGKIKNYQPYLESYFSLLDNKKTNFFTDISNYLSYELGQPTHCYDRKKLKSGLTFENKTCNEKFKTLLNNEILLEGKNCIFTSDNKIVGLAGIMGGLSTACDNSTYKVLIECAYFKPESIISKSLKYNLDSDAAYKFERGVDMHSQIIVLKRFLQIISEHATIKNAKIISKSYSDEPLRNLPIDEKKVNSILGTKIGKEKLIEYLRNLDFDVSDKIYVPSFRHDISSQNDIAEEIARLIGYDQIDICPLQIKRIVASENKKDINSLKEYLIKNGFNEVINFPFVAQKSDTSISVDNPIDTTKDNMRETLKDSLISNLIYNERRQKDSIKLFEVSDIYSMQKSIAMTKKIGIIISGKRGHNYIDFSKKLDKKYLQEILEKIIDLDKYNIEEISRTSLKTKRQDKIFFVEFNLSEVSEEFLEENPHTETNVNFNKFERISEFPSSVRDFSFSIKDFDSVKKVLDHLNKARDKNLKKCFMFDFYKNIKNQEIKVGYRFIFQSLERTLTDEDISDSISRILHPILKIDGVTVPGISSIEH